jgi:hypothetical protein
MDPPPKATPFAGDMEGQPSLAISGRIIERASLAGRALSVAGLEADFIYPLFQQAHRMARTVTVRNGTCPMA